MITLDERRTELTLTKSVCAAIEAAIEVEKPFFHLEFDAVFPAAMYANILAAMPAPEDYRPMSGRTRYTRTGTAPTRVKMDLFPEYIRHLPPEKQATWYAVGKALCSTDLQQTFVRKLAPGLQRRFGRDFRRIRLCPTPTLLRDVTGYFIPPHTDTHWKGITVQFYLPPDDRVSHIGTIFNERQPDGTFTKHSQMKFAPNTGYAFAVGDNTWHSVDNVGGEVARRDSILLTYLVDTVPWHFLRNRVRRLGNLMRNEWRQLRPATRTV